ADDGESGFDTDVALTTGELQKLIPELIEALGGEMAFDAAAAATLDQDAAPSDVTTAREPVTVDADEEGPPF
ncbi:MAG TPA: recombination-associated protein RdgC, partial [Hydrogenophaga sp.]|nr:recombination-associated protein RdgC [Hydrogenophaga sp.]